MYYYNGAQRYEQFLQVSHLYRASILLGSALDLLSASVSMLGSALDLLSASVSMDFMVYFINCYILYLAIE